MQQSKKIINPTDIIKQLKKKRKAFFLYQTLYTKKILTEDYNYLYTAKTELKNTDLAFIKKVKDHAQTLNNIPRLTSSDVHYIDSKKFKEGETIKNCYEIDLNSAFWNFAYREGFLS